MNSNSPDCRIEGHLISFVPGSKRDVLPEELGRKINDASGDGFIGCQICGEPIERLELREPKIPTAG